MKIQIAFLVVVVHIVEHQLLPISRFVTILPMLLIVDSKRNSRTVAFVFAFYFYISSSNSYLDT